jgi:hypothetical protein
MKFCTKCNNNYDNTCNIPKLLPCGHTYCSGCVESLYELKLLICPKDKLSFKIPIGSLSTNYSLLEALTLKKPIKVLKCCNNHDLNIIVRSKERVCNICQQKSNEYFQCALCIYQVCLNCNDWVNSTEVEPNGLVCFRQHVLRHTVNPGEFYNRIKKNNLSHFVCDGCLVKKKGSSAQCRECRVDYCDECTFKYAKIMDIIDVLFCKRKLYCGISYLTGRNFSYCNSRLAWRSDRINYSCTVCGSRFTKSGSFFCRECNKSYCIGCAYKKTY